MRLNSNKIEVMDRSGSVTDQDLWKEALRVFSLLHFTNLPVLSSLLLRGNAFLFLPKSFDYHLQDQISFR